MGAVRPDATVRNKVAAELAAGSSMVWYTWPAGTRKPSVTILK